MQALAIAGAWPADVAALGRSRQRRVAPKRFAEFFAGIGLVRLALERAGWACVFANDVDPRKTEIYRRNFASDDLVEGDLRALDPGAIPASIDLATASFPCVDLSLAGRRQGLHGAQSGLMWEFMARMSALAGRDAHPRLVLLENVTGFLSSRQGQDLRDAVARLNALGYACDAVVIDARTFVPQSRPRLFVVGARGRESHDAPQAHTSPLHDTGLLRPPKLAAFIEANRDLRWAPLVASEPASRSAALGDVLETLADGHPAWWTSARVDALLAQMSPRHRSIVDAARARRETTIGTVYRRVRLSRTMAEVRFDGVAGCLRVPRGGSSKQFVIVLGGGRIRVRVMTPREYARLQGAPDTFWIPDNANQAMAGFGDAVCVPVVEWLARSTLNRLVDGAGDRGASAGD